MAAVIDPNRELIRRWYAVNGFKLAAALADALIDQGSITVILQHIQHTERRWQKQREARSPKPRYRSPVSSFT